MCPSNLTTIVEMNNRKDILLRRVAVTWFTDKSLEWSLNLGKTTGIYCNLLLVRSCY